MKEFEEIQESLKNQDEANAQALSDLRARMQRMENESKELFDTLGVGAHQLKEILSNPNNYSPEVYKILQKQRELLEAALERKIQEKSPSKKRHPNDAEIRGHWIFVR